MASTLHVVANAPYAVSIDSGRDLHPGDIAKVDDSPRIRQLIEDGLLVEIEDPPKKVRATVQKEETTNAE